MLIKGADFTKGQAVARPVDVVATLAQPSIGLDLVFAFVADEVGIDFKSGSKLIY
jgi:hypothetical protein